MPRSALPALVFMALAAPPVLADSHGVEGLVVEDAYAFETPPGVPVGAGYFALTNTSSEAAVLVRAEADFPRVMIHESVEVDGVMQMEHRMAVEVPAQGRVVFEPGGLHIMFMGLEEPLLAGAVIPVTLVFQDGATLAAEFIVRERP